MRMLALLVIAACAPQYHVRLEPPRPGITPQERVELFWKRRATAQWQMTRDDELANQTLILGDKQPGVEEVEVVSPEDLEPLVGPDSETMQHARRSIAARNRARRLMYTGMGVLLGGFVTGIVLFAQLDNGQTWMGATFGASAVTSGVFYIFQRRATDEELTWRKRAFGSYTRDLGTRLDVCAQGLKVVPCEAP